MLEELIKQKKIIAEMSDDTLKIGLSLFHSEAAKRSINPPVLCNQDMQSAIEHIEKLSSPHLSTNDLDALEAAGYQSVHDVRLSRKILKCIKEHKS